MPLMLVKLNNPQFRSMHGMNPKDCTWHPSALAHCAPPSNPTEPTPTWPNPPSSAWLIATLLLLPPLVALPMSMSQRQRRGTQPSFLSPEY